MGSGKRQKRVAVAMSGGVDSSVAAALMCEKGYCVFGITARLTTEESRCCSPVDLDRARQVCTQLGIEHHVVDVRPTFQERVVDRFGDEYIKGRTPSPCVVCNREIKFGALAKAAREQGAERLATGHYARLDRAQDGVRLSRGVDPTKDQSYFLAMLSQEQLCYASLPLGAMVKQDVVRYAKESGLHCRKSRESQDVCFVTEGDHGAWLEVRRFDAGGEGDIVDTGGRRLGQHKGIHHYTIGQRRGLGVATGTPVYVVCIDAAANEVVVGAKEEVMGTGMRVAELSWCRDAVGPGVFECEVQIRYQHEAAQACVTINGPEAEVVFEEPQFAITPGQLAAFYEGDVVLGGGWIERSGR